MRPRATDDTAAGGRSSDELVPAALAARRLAVFGGSFDPPHAGHLWVAEKARAAFGLDHVLFVPAREPPHKRDRTLAPGGDRLALLALLLEALGWASAWAHELSRPGPSYSVDTLRALRARVDPKTQLFWILGSDNLAGLSLWREFSAFLALAQPIVIRRAGCPLAASQLDALDAPARARVQAGFLELEPFVVSASAIRAALAAGADPGPAFPPPLLEYVRSAGLFGSLPSP